MKILIPIGILAGAIVGYLVGLYSKWQSAIEVRIRPELANLNWYEAFFGTNHFLGFCCVGSG